ncbi:SH3 domain-containing protein [Candidatus Dojkabacteria bacterium]|nr:SH3 domain-containing protein [Candidatus Dojkabacteria bacterium]
MSGQIIDRDAIPYDSSLSDQEQNEYNRPEKIAVAKISPPAGVQYGDSNEWVRGLFYYSITKLKFSDIPFNYIVSWDGKSYVGKAGGYDVLPIVDWESSDESLNNCVVVVYFDNNREVTNSGKQKLSDVLSEVLSIYDLDSSKIIAADLSVSEPEGEVSLSKLILNKTGDTDWNYTVMDVKRNVTKRDIDLTYKGSIVSVEVPEKIGSGENFTVKVKIKNEGDFPWYNSGSNAAYIATSDPRNRDSGLYVSDKWDSFSRVVTSEEKWVLPGEEAEFEFEIDTPLIAGEYSEKFELLVLPDTWVGGTQFEVKFNVGKGDYDLVEIKDTETGYLNVRECPALSCKEVGKVIPGDILIKIERNGNWYKVKFSSNKEGWVYGKYVKDI